MDKKPVKIIMIDDVRWFHENLKREFGTTKGRIFTLISVFNQENAEEALTTNPDTDIIVVDACVPGSESNTMDLVKKLKTLFKGPIIAVASTEGQAKPVIDAGCGYTSGKYGVRDKILEILETKNKGL